MRLQIKKTFFCLFCWLLTSSFFLPTAGAADGVRLDEPLDRQKVVTLAPPLFSMLLTFARHPDFVVGASPRTFATANAEWIGLLYPDAPRIDTAFVGRDFNVNVEALLSLKPSVIFYYGNFERRGLENLSIPLIDTMLKERDPRALTIHWEELLAQAFRVDNPRRMETLWKRSLDKVERLRSGREGGPSRALVVLGNQGGVLQVCGADSYGQAFIEMAGLTNPASTVSGGPGGAGQVTVSMEQINAWNPEVVYCVLGATASELLGNRVSGQDWSFTEAFRTGRIFDVPRGTYSWGMPCADSPLMPLWLLSTLEPEVYGPQELRADMKCFYRELYGVDVPDGLIESILAPRVPSGRP